MNQEIFRERYQLALQHATEALMLNRKSIQPVFGVALPKSKIITGKHGDLKGKQIQAALVFVLVYTYIENGEQVIVGESDAKVKFSSPCEEWVEVSRVNAIIKRTGMIGVIPASVAGFLFTERHLLDAGTRQAAETWLDTVFGLMLPNGRVERRQIAASVDALPA